MRALFFFLFFAMGLSSVNAGNQTGVISVLNERASDGLIFFTLTGGPINDSPACSTIGYWMIKDEKSQVGQQQYSLLMAAAASGTTINVVGWNECTRWGDGEDVNLIQFIPE